jgi:hypothetical protein
MAQGIYFNAPGVHIAVGRPYHHYYNYYGGGGWNTASGCQPGWTVQGGVCKPYHYGPWDYYGGRHQDWGYR